MIAANNIGLKYQAFPAWENIPEAKRQMQHAFPGKMATTPRTDLGGRRAGGLAVCPHLETVERDCGTMMKRVNIQDRVKFSLGI